MTGSEGNYEALKKPPCNLDAERAVLGSCLINNTVIPTVNRDLVEFDFYDAGHRSIYAAINRLVGDGVNVDPTTLFASLSDVGELEKAGGRAYILQLEAHVFTTGNIESHVKIVKDKSLKRRLIGATQKISDRIYIDSTDAESMLSEATQEVFSIQRDHFGKSEGEDAGQAIESLGKRIDDEREGKIERNAIYTPFPNLNLILDGFRRKELVIVAGRTSHGKTAFAMNLAHHATCRAQHPVPTLFFSAEMDNPSITQRLIAIDMSYCFLYGNPRRPPEWGVPLKAIRNPKLMDAEQYAIFQNSYSNLSEAVGGNLRLYDQPGMGIADIEAISRHEKLRDESTGLIVVDYLQRVRNDGFSKNRSRQQEIGDITGRLKELSKELDVSVIALAQLSRAQEQRTKKERKPILSDLRESGDIEQDADTVIFVYRTDFYDDPRPNPSNVKLIVPKQRQGMTGEVDAEFHGAQQLFVEVIK